MSPDEWRSGKVIDFFELQRGFDITECQSKPGQIPVISSSGLAYYHNEAKVLGPGVVTGRKGSVGAVHFVKGDFWPHDTTLWVKDFKGNIPEYVKYFLEMMRLEQFDEASSVPTLNRNNVHGVRCHFPYAPEQSRILKILHCWAESIDLTERLIVANQERRKWLMQQLLTGKRRLPGFEKAWQEVLLRDHLREVSIRNRGEVLSKVLSVTNDRGFILPGEQFSRTIASSDLSNYKVVRRGQFAYNPSRINVGSWAMLDNYDEGVISPMYVVFETRKALNAHFFAYWMRSGEGQQRINLQSQGSVRDTVSFDALASIKILLPMHDEQAAILKVFLTADRELDLLRTQLEALREQKKGLMQQLLTGKVRVKVLEDKP